MKLGAGQVQIICTLGPSSYEPDVIRRLTDRRVDLLRINLSHTDVEDIEARINHVRTYTDVPLCLDTEGAQVRCGPVEAGLVVETGSTIELVAGA